MPQHVDALFTYPSGHPAFAGHFPGRPIVPGVLLLDAALHALNADSSACHIANAKFLRPVPPGITPRLQSEATPRGGVRFIITDDGGDIANGQIQQAAKGANP